MFDYVEIGAIYTNWLERLKVVLKEKRPRCTKSASPLEQFTIHKAAKLKKLGFELVSHSFRRT